MNVGDVHWIEFPSRGGHEQAGRRPAIIAQDASASSHLPTVLVVPLTTQQDALRFPGTVLIETDANNRLLRASIALVFQLTAVDMRLIGPKLGRVSVRVMDDIWTSFDEITGRGER